MITRFHISPAWLLAAILMLAPTNLSAQTARFVSVIDDLPLMAGLVEDTDAAMTFDSAAGRIAEAQANGPLAPETVQTFYSETLPQLGWRSLSGGDFLRGDEALTLEVEPTPGGGASARFRLRPAGAK